ncbi:MAG: hypothetical protein ABII27_04420 [bacterium]
MYDKNMKYFEIILLISALISFSNFSMYCFASFYFFLAPPSGNNTVKNSFSANSDRIELIPNGGINSDGIHSGRKKIYSQKYASEFPQYSTTELRNIFSDFGLEKKSNSKSGDIDRIILEWQSVSSKGGKEINIFLINLDAIYE